MVKRSTKQHELLRRKILSDPETRAEYEAFKLQLTLAHQLKQIREEKNLTQEKIAEAMHTQKSTVARIEAAGGKGRHSPSLKTLVKYAHATGCEIQIKLVPEKKHRRTG